MKYETTADDLRVFETMRTNIPHLFNPDTETRIEAYMTILESVSNKGQAVAVIASVMSVAGRLLYESFKHLDGGNEGFLALRMTDEDDNPLPEDDIELNTNRALVMLANDDKETAAFIITEYVEDYDFLACVLRAFYDVAEAARETLPEHKFNQLVESLLETPKENH